MIKEQGIWSPYAQQFLSTALSQRRPTALPYVEDVKWLIWQHLVVLAESFSSLHPKSSAFIHNDGRTVNLLQADGTIPIVYQGIVYNIPTVIWLLEPYPRASPVVFLSLTRDMVVKLGHPHVDCSGTVLVPYLRSWERKREIGEPSYCILGGLIQSTVAGVLHAFGRALLLDCSPVGKEGAFSLWLACVKAAGACAGFAVGSKVSENIGRSFGVAFLVSFAGVAVLIFGNVSNLGGAVAAGRVEKRGERRDPLLVD